MGMFDRLRKLDSSLQRGIDNGFARVFGGSVVAAELEEALKQEIENSLVYGQAGAIMAPDVLRVAIAANDATKLEEAQPHISFDLADSLTRFIRNEGWQLYRPLRVDIVPDESLHSGQLHCSSSHAVAYGPHGEVIRDETADGSTSSPQTPDNDDDAWRAFGGSFASGNIPNGFEAQSPTAGDFSLSVPPTAYPEPPANPMNAASAAAAVSAAAANLINNDEPPAQSPTQAQGSAPNHGQGPTLNQAQGQPASEDESPAQPSGNPQSQSFAQDNIPAHGQSSTQAPADQAQPAQPHQSPIYDDLANAPTTVHAAPRPAVTLLLQDGSSRTYHVREGSNVIGRGSAADFRLPDTGVSRKHAEILWDGHEAILVDLQSTNGTTVNDVPIDNWLLADGDIIVMGHSYIEVRINNPGAAS